MTLPSGTTPPAALSQVAVVIPCFKVKPFILEVIRRIPGNVKKIIVVDDACPEETGKYVESQTQDPRIEVLYNPVNLGVGGAVMRGYRHAIAQGAGIVVKLDGDGQMDAGLIPLFLSPLENGEADYTKGNRFYNPYSLRKMPRVRLICNAVLSLVTKFSTGYWDNFDPTNGYTAISAALLRRLPLDKISPGYFFESDMMFRLNLERAVIRDIPMDAEYGEEKSNLRIAENIGPFMKGHAVNFLKRIFYNYYLRNFSLASLELVLGSVLMIFGTGFGLSYWIAGVATHAPATAGTVMVAALPVILGFQMLMSFLNYDINNVPRHPLTRRIG